MGRERVKKIYVSNFIPTRPGLQNSKKNCKQIQKIKKTSFQQYVYPNWVEIGREREKKILVPNSVPTRPRQENSKKNIKKIQKIKKQNSDIISI